ncbi:hypothetical protein MLD38_010560 [Melastoma candidum]|uniref:Uncharacterized protein n=1 Tax=Melastoma candidum TaxID=119954 RepID=A0ACB9R082_9MYRT|nr:hypothetical protein MLD38_010560 [Melastoma candidum]
MLAVVLFAITVILPLSALAEEKIGYEDVGAWKPMEKLDDPNTVELAKFAVRKFNRAFEQKVEYKSIVKGEKQAGPVTNYKFLIEVKEDDKAAKRYEFVVLEKADKYGTKYISSIKLMP